jgi:hypothetical protein
MDLAELGPALVDALGELERTRGHPPRAEGP